MPKRKKPTHTVSRRDAETLAVAYRAYLEAVDAKDHDNIMAWGLILDGVMKRTDIPLVNLSYYQRLKREVFERKTGQSGRAS